MNDSSKSPERSDHDEGKDHIPRGRDYGYDFYPDRGGRSIDGFWSRVMQERAGARQRMKCISNVYACAKESEMVKLLLGALKAHGCPVDLTRHVSCERCTSRVNGGYDPITNQVVVCQNSSKRIQTCCSVLGHELTHMFDFCRAKVDFKNLEHLACTEIRAANFFHCSFMSAWADGDASMFSFKEKHQVCVKRKALMSVAMVRDVSLEEARAVVDKVFNKCYNDLEPFGRRPKRQDPQRCLAEGYLYGYTD